LLSEIELQIDNFMLYGSSKNLSRKTLKSYEQTLKMFAIYLEEHFKITEVSKVKSAHIRYYIKYLRERGKYTVVLNEKTAKVNHPDHRHDFNKPISDTTVSNYLRNIKVFFNYLYEVEREIKVNPVESIENIKPQRKHKPLLKSEEIVKVLRTFDITTFHGYRNWIITRLLLDTGMRISECLSITPENFDFKNKAILITNSKNRQQRYVYFSFKMSRDDAIP